MRPRPYSYERPRPSSHERPRPSSCQPPRPSSHQRPRPFSDERPSPPSEALRAPRRVYRFDGGSQTRSPWHGLRRDPDLWSPAGDCIVHLSSPSAPKPGPRLSIPFRVVQQSNSTYLLHDCLHRAHPPPSTHPHPPRPSPGGHGHGHGHGHGLGPSLPAQEALPRVDLYIPAPAHAAEHESHLFHLGTRNYLAYLLDAPLVGASLGAALIALWNRLQLWQPHDTIASGFRAYCQRQGYLSYANNPDYALASLHFCEQTKRKDMWVDAFAHCAGMHERLQRSEEMFNLSSTSRALLSAASLEMERHISQAIKALGSFLEEELGLGNLGLSKPLRDHLDLYRSTLCSFYVTKVGYWPPAEGATWDKSLWRRMYRDFRSLYEYLLDASSSNDRAENRARGGICVIQNLHRFDQRHNYIHLPHPLPLLPEQRARKRTVDLRNELRSFSLRRSTHLPAPRAVTLSAQALQKATNSHNRDVVNNALVQEYMRFERIQPEGKATLAEARKVRFMLVYCVLQTLISITRAPPEVRDAETPSYPLCILSPGYPPGMDDHASGHVPSSPVKGAHHDERADTAKAPEEDRISIHPDFEADNANDYFSSMNSLSRSGSDVSLSSMIPPTTRGSPIGRRESLMGGVSSLSRSLVGSIARTRRRCSLMSSRRDSTSSSVPRRSTTIPSHQEIKVEGYGGGLSRATHASRPPLSTRESHESIGTSVAELPADSIASLPTPETPPPAMAEASTRPGGPDDALKALESNTRPDFPVHHAARQPHAAKHAPTPPAGHAPPAQPHKPSTYASRLLARASSTRRGQKSPPAPPIARVHAAACHHPPNLHSLCIKFILPPP